MTVNSPRRENSFRESIFARPPDVIHDLIAAIFDNRFPNSRCNIIKHFIPTNPLPFSFPAFPASLQRIKNPIRISNLIQRCRPFRTIPPARSRILRIAFKFLNLVRVFVDVSEQPARRLAVKTSGRDQRITSLLPSRPRLRIQLSPIIPALLWRKRREMNARRAGITSLAIGIVFAH